MYDPKFDTTWWLEYYNREPEPLGEMATISRDEEYSIRIQTNPDKNRVGNPYFKAYNSPTLITGETKVVRLHFMNTGMEYHKDEYMDWIISNKDIKRIKKVLKKKYKDTPYTVWQMACFYWNSEYGVFYNRKDIADEATYFSGVYDKDPDFCTHPSYVPSTTEIPETWVYDPPRNKDKRS